MNGQVRSVWSASAPRADKDTPGLPARHGWARGEVSDRACLLAEIRQSILNGTYHYDALTIADRLLDRLPRIGATER